MVPLRWIFNRSTDSRFGNRVVLVFLVAQALDGVLTYIGVASAGHVTEGNPLVASLVAAVGLGPGLFSAKLWACGLGAALHLSGTHRLVALPTAIYFVAAIIPWTALLTVAS
jgi:Domain of unknown function (DUF5658)